MPTEADVPGITRGVRLPEWADIRLLEYCRVHNLMRPSINSHGDRIMIPNFSEGIKKIIIDFFNAQNNGK